MYDLIETCFDDNFKGLISFRYTCKHVGLKKVIVTNEKLSLYLSLPGYSTAQGIH